MRTNTARLIASLRLRQLELISTLADTRNMRAASQRLSVTTAAVSKGLREVETLFGTVLFHRLPQGLVPTSAGMLVVQRARTLMNEVAQLSDELATETSDTNERIKIGAPPFIAWTLVPELLQSMWASEGPTRADIIEGRLGDICRQLEAGDIDVLITMNSPSELGGLKPDGFVIEQIGVEYWRVVCSPEHPLAPSAKSKAARTWKSLIHEKWILPPRPTNSRMMVEQVLLHHDLAPLVPNIETMNAVTHLRLVEKNLGITLAAQSAAQDGLNRGTLVEIPMENLPPPVPIVLVYRLNGAYKGAVASLRAAAQRIRKDSTLSSADAAPSSARSNSSSIKKLPARKSRP